jgi:hypothetical protein
MRKKTYFFFASWKSRTKRAWTGSVIKCTPVRIQGSGSVPKMSRIRYTANEVWKRSGFHIEMIETVNVHECVAVSYTSVTAVHKIHHHNRLSRICATFWRIPHVFHGNNKESLNNANRRQTKAIGYSWRGRGFHLQASRQPSKKNQLLSTGNI